MAKGSGRFRNRKLGFKTRINVEVGVVIEEDPLDIDLDLEDDKGHKGVETGVDKDEEGEVHLQAVIASTAAYVARNTSASGRSSVSSSAAADKGKKPEASIPTRGSVKIPEDEYRQLYDPGYSVPVSYIRFSDTVEDVITGAYNYTMDEDDEDWLEDFNAQFEGAGADSKPKASTSAAGATENGDVAMSSPSGRGVRPKGKAADRNAPPTPSTSQGTGLGLEALPAPTAALSEEDFEYIMELFETVTDQKAPMAHVDVSLLPVLNDFDAGFSDVLKPHLSKLRPFAKEVYPHWRQRRSARGGKPIIPQLDVSLFSSGFSLRGPILSEISDANSTTSRTRTTPTFASGDETSRRRARRAGRTSRTSSG